MSKVNQQAVNAMLDENTAYRDRIKNQKKRIYNKWNKTGLLGKLHEDDILGEMYEKNPEKQMNLAILLDNQLFGEHGFLEMSQNNDLPAYPDKSKLKRITEELQKKNLELLKENKLNEIANVTQTATNFEAWSDVAFPLVRKYLASPFAEQLVNVQAMTMPSTYIFNLDFQYVTDKPANYDKPQYWYSQSDSIYGDTDDSTFPTGAFYGGTDRYSYSRNYVSASNVIYLCTTRSNDWSRIDYDTDLSESLAGEGIYELTVAKSNVDGTYTSDTNQLESMLIKVSDSGTIFTQYPRYTRYDGTTNYTFIVSASSTAPPTGAWVDTATGSELGGTASYIEFVKHQGTEQNRGDFEYSQPGVGPIPELKMEVTRSQVTADTRKLKTTWTPEDMQDLAAYQGLDLENEMTDIMSKFIAIETDLHILNFIRANTVETQYWSLAPNNFVKFTDGTPYTSKTITTYNTLQEWLQTLYFRITSISNRINARTHLGPANKLVMHTDVASILQNAGVLGTTDVGSILAGTGNPVEFNSGVANYIGTLNNTWQCYSTPNMRNNEMIILRKGASWNDAGIVYAPYIPLTYTDTLVSPTEGFTMAKGAMTRYALHAFRKEFYARLIILDMDVI